MLSFCYRHHGSLRSFHSRSVLLELTERGFIQDLTRRDHLIHSTPQTIYTGIDPTAPSLHIGHLIPLLSLVHFHIAGHTIIPLVGSATGRIGDPSGRTTPRKIAHLDNVNKNVDSLSISLRSFLSRAISHARSRLSLSPPTTTTNITVLSNIEWHKNFSIIDFLQHVGIHARVNTMLNRESVKARLSSHSGLSFTEFTYQLLQAYDFYHLYTHHGCTTQVGGSDQWGNILAGIELIGKLTDADDGGKKQPEPYGITTPLLTTASGEKFGKSAGNAVWLDESLTSVFDFYQYFLKVTDADLSKYLNIFTFLSKETIQQIIELHKINPEKRIGQRKLAEEVTEMVHGHIALSRAQTLSALFFSPSTTTSPSPSTTPTPSTTQPQPHPHYKSLTTSQIISAFGSDDTRLIRVPLDDLLTVPICKLAAGVLPSGGGGGGDGDANENGEIRKSRKTSSSLVPSISASRALIASKGLYFNDVAVSDIKQTIQREELVDGRVAVLRAGKDRVVVYVGE